MNHSVVPIRCSGKVDVASTTYLPESEHTLVLPSVRKVEEELRAHLNRVNLDADAMSLWIGYPNLAQSVGALGDWVGADWPSQEFPGQRALFVSVTRAISCVKEGLAREEYDRRLVIANFHNGLMDIAKDLAGYCAWGCTSQKTVEQWEPFALPFHTWCDTGRFDKVLFSRVEKINEFDQEGLIWKMRSCIAPIYDIGVSHRYGAR